MPGDTPTDGMLDFVAAVVANLSKVSPEAVEHYKAHKDQIPGVLACSFRLPKDMIVPWAWTVVYSLLGMSPEYERWLAGNKDKLQALQAMGLWVVPVLKGVTPNKLVIVHRKLDIKVWLYAEDLDASVTENDRDPNRDGSYAVGFKPNVEADSEYHDRSANMLKEESHRGITLTERLLMGIAYFLATGKHLDVDNVTLCSGSRYSDGSVPIVDWYPDSGKVYVDLYDPDDRSDDIRSRSAVIL